MISWAMPPPPKMVTRAPNSVRPAWPVHRSARLKALKLRRLARVSARACSATGSL